MHLHEYQAKILLQSYGIPVPPYIVIHSLDEMDKALDLLGEDVIVKVQIHAGGRGKAGGVVRVKGRQEIFNKSKELLGKRIVSVQTGPAGMPVQALILTPPVQIAKEFYVAITHDRATALPVLIISSEGGVEIEEVAKKTPEKILTLPLTTDAKVRGYQAIQAAKFLGWQGELLRKGERFFSLLAKLFNECDATLLEVNPLVITPEGDLWALDAKCTIDDNALYRQANLLKWEDPSQKSPAEQMAHAHDLSYISLAGDIGCLVNGAGLAMATMDLIHHEGGKPANFLDVGGGASKEKIAQGFRILLSDSQVKAIFVNIFGGILDCSLLAQGIVEACKEVKLNCPLVVRLEGTRAKEAREILNNSSLPIRMAKTMIEGAQAAIRAARGESWES